MKTDKLRELISEYFDDINRRSIENINQYEFSADVRKSYQDAIRYLNADIQASNKEPLDIYTQVDDFKHKSKISSDEFEKQATIIVPMLRQASLDHYTKLIEYGDAKKQAQIDKVLSSNNVVLGVDSVPLQNSGTLLVDAISEFIKERSKLGAVGSKHIDSQKSDLELCVIIHLWTDACLT